MNYSSVIIEMAPSSPSMLGRTSRLEGPLTPAGDAGQEEHDPQLQPRISVSIKREVRRVSDRLLSRTWLGPDRLAGRLGVGLGIKYGDTDAGS
jgi:hypothetical protein